MRKCIKCDNKHHAKNYCKTHYNKIILINRPVKICSIDGCISTVEAKTFCCKHYNRFKRHGDPLKTTRYRKHYSIEEFKENTDIKTFLSYVFKSRSTWATACKIYYGDKCNICDWNKVTCDVHHIKQVSKKGEHTVNNGQILCPNCHAEKHRRLTINQRT